MRSGPEEGSSGPAPVVRRVIAPASLEEELRARSVGLLTAVVLAFGPVYLLWGLVLDRWLAPAIAGQLLIWRLVIVGAVFGVMGALRRFGGPRWSFEAMLVILVGIGLSAVVICGYSDHELFPYAIGGLALTIVSLGVLPLWPVRWTAAALSVVGLASVAMISRTATDPPDAVSSVFTVAAAAGIGFFSARWRYQTFRETYEAGQREATMTAELIAARDEAVSAMHAKSIFLANISHEIRTPMNAVLGYASFLAEAKLAPEQRDWVLGIENAGQLLLGLINDVLDLAKLEESRIEIEARRFDLEAVTESTLSLVRASAEKKGLKLMLQLDPSAPRSFLGDPVRIQQVLLNLLSNAVKFTSRGVVRVRWHYETVDERRCRLRADVIDSGIGMSPEQLQRLFTPFTQADAAITRRYGGTGLGLSIARHLVEAMGGAIEVDSRPGAGSRFTFTIDVGRDSDVNEPAPSSGDVTVPTNLHVLVAEDNPVNQRIVSRILVGLGCTVEVVSDGAEALALLETKRFDLVLMDAQMPVLDGLEATRRLRLTEQGRTQRVVALTANATDEVRRACEEAGMDAFLTKPVSREQLRGTLAEIMVRSVAA